MDSAGYAIQQLLNAIVLGCHLALLTLGYSLVHSVVRQFNLAHGSLLMLGAYGAFVAASVAGALGFMFPGGLVAALSVGVGTGAVYALIKLPLFRTGRAGDGTLAALVSATGLLIFFAELVRLLQSSGPLYSPPVFGLAMVLPISTSFPVTISGNDFLVVGVTAAAVLLTFWIYQRSTIGMLIRACADDRGMAALVGVDPNRTIAITLMLAGALAGLGGFLTVAHYGIITPYMGWSTGLKALTAAVVGGVGSLRGALLGAFLIAGLETFWSAWFNLEYRDVVVFTVLVTALIFRPNGLFARPEPDRAPGIGGQLYR